MEACTTKAHRSFLLLCPHGLAACQGKYGHHNPDATHHAARLAHAKFLFNQNVLVEGAKCAVLAKQAVWQLPEPSS